MKDGYAIVTPTGVGDATLAAVDKGTLAQNATFTGDMGALGEQGIVSAWFDMGTGLKEIQKLSGDDGHGRRPRWPRPRVASRQRCASTPTTSSWPGSCAAPTRRRPSRATAAELANLPANTMAALHISGADQMLDSAWPQLKKQLDSLGAAGGGSTDLVGRDRAAARRQAPRRPQGAARPVVHGRDARPGPQGRLAHRRRQDRLERRQARRRARRPAWPRRPAGAATC